MKVLMVYPFEFPGLDRWEGSRSRLFSFCEGLTSRGVEVHVLARRDPYYSGLEYRGARFLRFWEYGGSVLGRGISSLMIGQSARSLEKEFRFDVIQPHLPIAAASVGAWRRGIRSQTLFDTHDWFKLHDELYYNLPFIPGFLSGAVDRAEGELARRHDGVAVTTPLLSAAAGGGRKTYVVPNMVDTEHFRPGASKIRGEWFRDEPVILFLGSVTVHQGLFELIAALKLVLKTKVANLLVIGGGLVEEAKSFASRLGISERVKFTGPGRVPYEDLPGLINAADVAVSPLQRSPRYQEFAQPLKVLEYLACGRPTVVTPLAEQSRLVAESHGGAVADGFGREPLARAILSALRNGHTADSASARGYVVRNHSPSVVLDRLMGAYEDLLKVGQTKPEPS